jgi:hypothetical protein
MSLMDENDARECAELFRKFVDQIEDGKPYEREVYELDGQ